MSVVKKVPSYCQHKTKKLAFVKIHGRIVYLGAYGSPDSIKRYEKVIAEHLADLPRDDAITVVELCAQYLDYADKYYTKNGKHTTEYDNVRIAIKKLRRLYGDVDVDDFRPRCLRALQHAWVADGLSRGSVNRYAQLVKRVFECGVSMEQVMPETHVALSTVPGLKKGRVRIALPPNVLERCKLVSADMYTAIG
jgi:hypothetical protein